MPPEACDAEIAEIVQTDVVEEVLESLVAKRKTYPRLGGGNQKSYRLSGRITRHVSSRSKRHEVSEAEVVRSMLNERIDYDEMMERAFRDAVGSEVVKDRA